jgi:hypothetical protein
MAGMATLTLDRRMGHAHAKRVDALGAWLLPTDLVDSVARRHRGLSQTTGMICSLLRST